MRMPLDQLNIKVNAFINETHAMLAAAKSDPQTMKRTVIATLDLLIQDFGTRDYGFNLAMEQYVRYFRDLVHLLLPEILEEKRHCEGIIPVISDDMNVAFAAFYALSLIYKKEGNIDALKELACNEDYPFVQLYPITYEVQSRYYKRIKEYTRALQADEWALRFLGSENIAVGISYASTVCMMYEEGQEVKQLHWEYADRYISDALGYNPNYAKYYFLRGKLIFYSNRHIQNLPQFQEKCDEATGWIIQAQRLEHSRFSKFTNAALNEYQLVLDRIQDELEQRAANTLPFQPMNALMLQQRIDKVLAEEDERPCRPPNPNLKPGQHYFFISYCHADFKAVYCDLLRLYAKKIPFQYDGDLSAGDNWVEKIHAYINKPECQGVIFYISKHTPLSEAVEQECRILRETLNGSKKYFSVNLEGDAPPAEILFQCIRENSLETLQAKRVDNGRMLNFLHTFHKDAIYVRKLPGHGPASERHMDDLLTAIQKTFTPQQNGEQAPVPAGV